MGMTATQKLFFNKLADYNIHRYDDEKKIFKYVNAETAKLILADGSLKFSTPKELNDNDMEPCLLIMNLNLKQLREKKQAGLMNALMEHGKYTHKEARKYVNSKMGQTILQKAIPTDKYADVVLESYTTMQTTYRFFCATTSNDNERMWQSYGNNDRGVCIEYKFPTFFTSEYFAFKVFYDREFKPFDFFEPSGKENAISIYRWFFTKRVEYEFEDEVRLITMRDADLFTFPKEIFTGIYYGKQTSQNDIVDIEKLLQNGYGFSKGEKAIY